MIYEETFGNVAGDLHKELCAKYLQDKLVNLLRKRYTIPGCIKKDNVQFDGGLNLHTRTRKTKNAK